MNEGILPHGAHSSNNLTPAPSQGELFMDETTLGKLSRAQLQKVAKVRLAFLVLSTSH